MSVQRQSSNIARSAMIVFFICMCGFFMVNYLISYPNQQDRTSTLDPSGASDCLPGPHSIPGIPVNAVGNDDHPYWKDPEAWKHKSSLNVEAFV